MPCPHCGSNRITQLQRTTTLGDAIFYCQDGHRTLNERTSNPFNCLQFPTDIVFQVLLCRLRDKLSYREVAEFCLLRGFQFTHETVRDGKARFAPIFADDLRAKRKGKVGNIWHVDETYLRIQGR